MVKSFFADKDIIKYLLSKGGITFLFRIIAMAFGFINMWFITKFYGEAVFGSYTVALTVLQITVMVFSLGIPYAFVGFTGEFNSDEKAKGLLVKCLKIALLAAIVPIVIHLFGASFITERIFQKINLYPYFLILAASIPFMIVHEIMCYYFVSVKKFTIYGLFIFIIPNVLFIILLLLCYHYKAANYYTFLSYTASFAITVILGFFLIFKPQEKIIYPNISVKQIIAKSFPMMISGIFIVLLNWTDILMLGRIATESEIGIYNVAFKIGYLAMFFVVSMNVVIMPKVSELFHQNKFDEMKKTINKATQVVIILTIPLAMVIIFFGEMILSVFGEGFVAGSTTLTLITLGALFNAMTGNVDQVLNMTNNQKFVSKILLIGFLLNVVLNLFLIPKYGTEGAATSSLITNVVVNIIFVIVIKKKLGFYTFM